MQKGTFPKSTFLRKGGLALCLAAATSMAIGPTVAYAGQTYTESAISPTALTAGLLDVGEEGYEYDISKSETVSVTGTEGNVYTGEALDPIFMYDSANSSLSEYNKSTGQGRRDVGRAQSLRTRMHR